MLKKWIQGLWVLGLAAGLTGSAAAQDFVKGALVARGRKIEGYLRARSNGDIEYRPSLSNPTTQRVPRDQISRIIVPKPRQVAALEQLFEQGKLDEVIKNADTVNRNHGWLGWGGLVHFMKGRALMAKGDFTKAKNTFRDGLKYARAEGRYALLKRGELEVRIMDVDPDKGDPALERDLQRAKPSPFKYKALGMLSEAKGRKNDNDQNLLSEAALHYMKVILVYDPEDMDSSLDKQDRRDCYKRLVAVLKTLKDSRAANFEAMMRQEYR